MMLHSYQAQASLSRPLLRPRRRQIPRMQIVHHHSGSISNVRVRCFQRLFEELQSRNIFEIAQMLALINKPPARQRQHILQVPADGQQRPRLNGNSTPSGTKPLARRSSCGAPSTTAATESSQRCRISRLCIRNASAIPPNRLSASSLSIAIGSSLRFALVSPGPSRAHRQTADAATAHTEEKPPATARPAQHPPQSHIRRPASQTIGRAEVSSSASSFSVSAHTARAASTIPHHTAAACRSDACAGASASQPLHSLRPHSGEIRRCP